MEKILTARELSEKIGHGEIEMPNELRFVEACMIEFAKMHVKAALKSASENAKIVDVGIDYSIVKLVVEKDSIINSYLLENIK